MNTLYIGLRLFLLLHKHFHQHGETRRGLDCSKNGRVHVSNNRMPLPFPDQKVYVDIGMCCSSSRIPVPASSSQTLLS